MTGAADRQWLRWYEQFDKTHGPQKRQEWYSDAAIAYRWARPRYPEKIIDRVLKKSQPAIKLDKQQIGNPKTDKQQAKKEQTCLLEIGCGPGIATESLAAKGLRIVAVEPSAAACNLARESCRDYRGVTIINSTFEQYELQQQYDVVLAATCFHWISPEVACSKPAAALKPNGSFVLLWATPPQPSADVSEYLQPVYERYGLTELSEGQRRSRAYYLNNFELFAQTINQSGYFEPSGVELEQHQSTYSIEKYLALLSTLSPYIELDTQERETLLKDLGDRLSDCSKTGSLDTTHWFASQVAPLKSST